MTPARIILLVVALVAGGLAAFLATRGDRPAPQQVVSTQLVQEAKTQILVARSPIGVGERLTPDTVEWADWPEGAVRSDYVTIAAQPDATTEMTGAVARFEFFPGEPIREVKLVRADQGYLSAVLPKGMRGVSIDVAASSGAGGFIVPNDRVDVILTRALPSGQQVSQPILTNVKVLAIGARLGEVGATGGQAEGEADADPQAQVFTDTTIATLELDPNQADTIINATAQGRLSLTLRSIADFGGRVQTVAEQEEDPEPVAVQPVYEPEIQQSTTVRIIRFGQETSVMPTSDYSYGAAPDIAVGVDAATMSDASGSVTVDQTSTAAPPSVQ